MQVCSRKTTGTIYSFHKLLVYRRISSSEIIVGKPTKSIASITLNRHDGKNSFSRSFLHEFVSSINAISKDRDVAVLILNSSVPKVFCAGADLKERATMSEEDVETFVDNLRNSLSLVENLPFPTIASIDGVALGGGLELALACDLRIAHADALLGLPETALAIIPGAGGTQRLPRLLGAAKAKELIFMAKRLSGSDAAKIGLVTECVSTGSSFDRAMEVAVALSEKGPMALRMAKKAINDGMQCGIEEGLQIEKRCYAGVIRTADRREGLRAFAEKRKPNYTGQ